jgi:peptidoglycan DL-endopeptidase LytE
MRRFVVMLGIGLLFAGGLLPLHAEARGATRRLVEVRDQDLVRDAQRQLKAQGFYPGAIDGDLGPQTATALRAYQRSHRLQETGRLDEATLRSLLPERSEVSGAPAPVMPRAPVDLSNREVLRDAQRQLKALGFNPGSTDGTFGPQTEAALRAYQQAYRLPETGRLDETTGRSLLRERFETSRAPFEASRGPIDLSNREVIRDAQRQLKGLGFNPGAVDGHFGSQTAAALRAYQQAYRLPATGSLGEATVRSLLPERFEASRAPFEAYLAIDPSNREVIRPAQRQLKTLGFNPGAVDGHFGSQTAAALRAYQQAYRLPETGKLDEVTLRSLLPEQVSTSPAPIDFSDRKLISRAQIQLRTLGFDPGAVDGELGQQTEAALQAYQHAYRLPETGRLDEATVRSLLPQMRQGALR